MAELFSCSNGGINIAKVTHQLEIIVNAAEPVAEINNVISAFLQLHGGKEVGILTELQAEISAAIEHYGGAKE